MTETIIAAMYGLNGMMIVTDDDESPHLTLSMSSNPIIQLAPENRGVCENGVYLTVEQARDFISQLRQYIGEDKKPVTITMKRREGK